MAQPVSLVTRINRTHVIQRSQRAAIAIGCDTNLVCSGNVRWRDHFYVQASGRSQYQPSTSRRNKIH